MAVVIQLFEG